MSGQSPWHGESVVRKPKKTITEFELDTGITPDEYEAIHGAMRARVRARYQNNRRDPDELSHGKVNQ